MQKGKTPVYIKNTQQKKKETTPNSIIIIAIIK